MNFKVSVQDFQEAVKRTQLVNCRIEGSPALIQADSSGVTVTTAGFAGIASASVSAEVDVPGSVTVPAMSLGLLAARLSGTSCSVEMTGTAVVIKTDSQQLSLGVMDSTLSLPEKPDSSEQIDGLTLADAIKRASIVADRASDKRYCLDGVQLLPSGKGMEIAASDGHAAVQIRVDETGGLTEPVIVPLGSVPLLLTALSADCSISCIRGSVLSVHGGSIIVNVGLANGRFPNISQVMGDGAGEFSAFESVELMRAVESATAVARNKQIDDSETHISISEDGIEVSTSGALGEVCTKVPAGRSKPGRIKLNPWLLKSVIRASAGYPSVSIDAGSLHIKSDGTRAILLGMREK